MCCVQVLSIRWFYDVLLEKLGGGALNPASTSTFKQLMKALAYLMGQRESCEARCVSIMCIYMTHGFSKALRVK